MSTKGIKVFFILWVTKVNILRRALNKSLKINSIFIYLSIFPWPQICVLEFQTFVLNSQHQGDANFVKFELHFSTLPLVLLEIFSFQSPIEIYLFLINFTKNISCEIDFTKFWWTYFDCHSVTWFPVNPTINNTKLTRTQNFIRENLVGFWNIFFFLVRLFRSAIKFRWYLFSAGKFKYFL